MIKIDAVKNNDPNLRDRAFPTPGSDEVIAFNKVRALPEYVPFVVRVTSKNGNLITFHALGPEDASKATQDYSLDLTNIDHVWRRLPSTLDDWEPGTKDCALLFLNQTFLDGGDSLPDGSIAPPRKDLIAAAPKVRGGCSKWPCSAGDLRPLDVELATLRRERNKLQDDYAKLTAVNSTLQDEAMKLRHDNAALTEAFSEVQKTHAEVNGHFAELKLQVKALKGVVPPGQLAGIDRKFLE